MDLAWMVVHCDASMIATKTGASVGVAILIAMSTLLVVCGWVCDGIKSCETRNSQPL
ncbi:hypothetical protein KC19_3G017100 [Ceratodon purpureus]|uniref:Uncharacterized protein n=1 Tax=Ceratodon purpureus TaxID=3225 RepID=A0A8T0IDS0_CERPU|nr:hypothetical protein KC19_3G017100 [Ceratodon purpureus]